MKLSLPLALGAALLTTACAQGYAQQGPRGGRGPAMAGAMFEQMDADRDGRVAWAEAWNFAQARFAAADTDRSGGLSLAEFQAQPSPFPRPEGAPPPPPGMQERRAEMRARMFRALDANQDGQVTLAEMQPSAAARFRAMDANADGAITRDELPQRRGRAWGAPGQPASPAR
jgi:hypothetical protein